jgi:hypothetical protein
MIKVHLLVKQWSFLKDVENQKTFWKGPVFQLLLSLPMLFYQLLRLYVFLTGKM